MAYVGDEGVANCAIIVPMGSQLPDVGERLKSRSFALAAEHMLFSQLTMPDTGCSSRYFCPEFFAEFVAIFCGVLVIDGADRGCYSVGLFVVLA